MESFEPYVQKLESLAVKLLNLSYLSPHDHLMIESALNGQPSEVLRSLVSIAELRESGVFFTSRHLSEQLVSVVISEIKQGTVIYDPTCGAGDLLLACARHLPIADDLETTLSNWNRQLKGADLYHQFTKVAKIRLLLLAVERGSRLHTQPLILQDIFPDIQVRNTLISEKMILDKVCIIINPPYSMVEAPETCTWTSGLVSQAALYLEKCVKDASPGAKIVAILPDVLRTGTRYRKWRGCIEQYATIEKIELAGCFDALTDIDIFICYLIVENNSPKKDVDWWASEENTDQAIKKVDDYFEVRVGPVVPHRHRLEGPLYPYVHAHQLPAWDNINVTSEFRNFSGTTFDPPFVVVRRTSRPGDRHRAIGTIITGENPVAVENHLIVLKPKSGLLEECFQLIEVLRSPKTSKWLNERICCRHLTVTAMRDLPWWIENEF